MSFIENMSDYFGTKFFAKGVLLFLLASFLFPASLCAATDMTLGDAMAKRVGKGVIDIILSPTDVVNTMEDIRFKEGFFQGITYGTVKGLGTAVQRIFYGFYEIATFYEVEKNENSFPAEYDSAVFRF